MDFLNRKRGREQHDQPSKIKRMSRILAIFTRRFPRNFMVQYPLWGALILMSFCFLFALLYRPQDTHASWYFNYPATMAIYCLLASSVVWLLMVALRKIPWFSDHQPWSFIKEILSIAILLLGMGIAIYFLAFLLEAKTDRWNFATLWNSCSTTFAVGVIPFAFFTLSNYRYLFLAETLKEFAPDAGQTASAGNREEKIHIVSQLKKEELSFYSSEFLYAESDGNYVVFYLTGDTAVRKTLIRNSITSIEKQLEPIPWFVRTHRAFIVNVKKIRSKQGNALGYRLKLAGTDSEIPVSRQKVSEFDQALARFI